MLKTERDECKKCSGKGHVRKGDKYVRCECLKLELMKNSLGVFYCKNVVATTTLLTHVDRNIIIEGSSLSAVRTRMARVVLEFMDNKKTVAAVDGYRLIEILFERDEEYLTYAPIVAADLLVIMLGFGDITNKRLPDCVLQVLNRRDLLQKPTWFILGIPLDHIATKYNVELSDKLKSKDFYKVTF